MLKVSVLVPAFNEEKTILKILGRVREQHVDDVCFEVIVIDDGSQDGTVKRLQENPSLYDRLIIQPTNGGKGAAVKAGLRAATGDYVLFQDADLEYDPAEFSKLLLPVMRFDADVVMGSRFLAPQYTRVHYFMHKFGNNLITLMFNVLFSTTFTDIYTCYLMFRRELVNPDELRTSGWEQHAEILATCVKRSKRYYDVPISYHGRTYEEGKKIRARHVVGVIRTIVAERFWHR
jgi:glycosyltransferase involved in cell wall biosynthesis